MSQRAKSALEPHFGHPWNVVWLNQNRATQYTNVANYDFFQGACGLLFHFPKSSIKLRVVP